MPPSSPGAPSAPLPTSSSSSPQIPWESDHKWSEEKPEGQSRSLRKLTDHKTPERADNIGVSRSHPRRGSAGGKGPARLCGGSGNSGYSGLEQGAPRPIAKGTAGTASPAPTLRRREHRHHLVGESACRQLAGSSAERPPQVGGEMEHVLPAPPGSPPAAHLGPCGTSRPQNAAGKRPRRGQRPVPPSSRRWGAPGAAVWDGRGSQSLLRSQPCPSAA